MTDPSQRRYLDDVPQEVQDLIYEQRMPEAIQLQMTTKGMNKVGAAMEVAGILSRMQAAFPDAMPEPPPGPGASVSPTLKSIAGWTFLILFTLVAAAMTFFGGRGLLRGYQSKSWPSVQGKVIASAVKEYSSTNSKGRSRDKEKARISYTFSVEGTEYTGDRIDYHGRDSGGESARAGGLVRRYPVGKKIKVYYQPGNPNICVLEPGSAASAFGLPGIGLFLLLLAGVFWAAAISVTRDEQKEPTSTPTDDIFKSPHRG